MPESQPVLRRLSVEGFRGFRDRMEFDLSASVVLLQGPNGTGKTSLFDAIQWALLGDIGRLQAARTRQNTEHILNAYTTRQTAVVEVDMVLGGETIALRRTGTYRSSVLEWSSGSGDLTGPAAESALASALAPGDLDLEAAMLASGLMQQDAMRQVLQTKPRDRYDQISEFLGLGVLQRFEAQASDYAARCSSVTAEARAALATSDRELTNARQRLDTVRALNAAKPSVQQAWQALLAAAADAPLLEVQMPKTPSREWAERLSGQLSELAGHASDLAGRWSRWRLSYNRLDGAGIQELPSMESDLSRLELEVESARRDLSDARLRSEAFEAANDEVARLVAAALPMISGPTCPVCGREIDPQHLRAELSARAASAAQLADLRAQVAEAAHSLAQTQAKLDSARSTFASARARAEEAATLDNERARLQLETEALASRSSVTLRVSKPDVASNLREAESQSLRLLAATRQLLGVLDAVDNSEEQQLQAVIARASGSVRLHQGRLEEASQLEQRARNLAASAVAARTQVTGERFAQLRPLVRDIFDRLAPHPTFTEIDMASQVYRSHGTATPLVRDRLSEVDADPLLVLSASHANITALAYFLAMGLAAGQRALPFLLLDDPLQAMDDINVLGFADLCRQLRGDRQIIVSVHERRFAQLLERKLAPRYPDQSTLMMSFLGWDRSGPTVKARPVEGQLDDPPNALVATLRKGTGPTQTTS